MGFAGVIAVNEVLNWSYRFGQRSGCMSSCGSICRWHVCGITVFAAVIMLVFWRQMAYEIVYFWGLVGATNAVVTPQVEFGYPAYRFFQYFIAHGGIVAAALFATWGLGMAADRQVGSARFCFAECSGRCFDRRQSDAGEQLYVSLPTA